MTQWLTMTLNDLCTKVKVIHFGTNRFLIYGIFILHSQNLTILKLGLCKVIQGHRPWCQSKAHIWPPISH